MPILCLSILQIDPDVQVIVEALPLDGAVLMLPKSSEDASSMLMAATAVSSGFSAPDEQAKQLASFGPLIMEFRSSTCLPCISVALDVHSVFEPSQCFITSIRRRQHRQCCGLPSSSCCDRRVEFGCCYIVFG